MENTNDCAITDPPLPPPDGRVQGRDGFANSHAGAAGRLARPSGRIRSHSDLYNQVKTVPRGYFSLKTPENLLKRYHCGENLGENFPLDCPFCSPLVEEATQQVFWPETQRVVIFSSLSLHSHLIPMPFYLFLVFAAIVRRAEEGLSLIEPAPKTRLRYVSTLIIVFSEGREHAPKRNDNPPETTRKRN